MKNYGRKFPHNAFNISSPPMSAPFTKPESERSKSAKKTRGNVASELYLSSVAQNAGRQAISVIIPMYNRKKYIGECLDSLLAQTFQSFEVIVIDDCSTDNSVEIVEGYAPKFNGRLKLLKMEKNSGHPGVPRNKGIANARGEYIYCLDSDDMITKTALEEMYTLGKEYDADVVYCEKYFMSEGTGQEFKDNMRIADTKVQKPPFVYEPTIETDLTERVKKLLRWNYWMSAALKIVKRDLLIDNNITFPSLVGSEDDVWSLEILFCSKRFLRIPNICFIRRIHEDGISFGEYTTPDHVQRWMDVTIRSLKDLDNFMGGIEFFRKNPSYRYDIIARSVNASFGNTFKKCETSSAFDIYKIFQEKFGDVLGDHDVLVSAVCAYIINKQKDFSKYQELALRLPEAQKHITELETEIERLYEKKSVCISVIIPLYNAENYVGEMLDSLLFQTFEDFEVIVVDDRSTDNSFEVVKSYVPKFNGRLKLVQLEKNSGGAGEPRNVGLTVSRGEYVIFFDADDYVLFTALETLYNAAKEYDADVVYTSSYYNLVDKDDIYLYRDGMGRKLLKEGLEDEPTLTVDDQNKLLEELLLGEPEGNLSTPWPRLVRRKLLIENKIAFPLLPNCDDFIWVINVYSYAKRFLRIPTPFYFYRRHTASLSLAVRAPEDQIAYWISSFVAWAKALNELENRTEILKNNPVYCHSASSRHFEYCLRRTKEAQKNFSSQKVYEILHRELGKKNDSFDLVLSLFFSAMDAVEKNSEKTSQAAKRLRNFLTARIDIQFVSAEDKGNFKIVSVSDEEANVTEPAWLQKGGIGYMITSSLGKIKFVVKASAAGQIKMNIRGLDVRTPEDNTKRIPYWINYNKMLVNGKTVFDKLTPVWHDKPYRYNLDVKAYEEITVQLEWSSDASAFAPQEVKPPAISVIIPMYNTEEYVGECLDSLLIQTFQDFEVIVVDDCSTDNSVAVVESYTEKFDGRLKLIQTRKNSGTIGYVARNTGFKFSRGEYVYFMDSDDFLAETALETLYNAAKEYDVDVVYNGIYNLLTTEDNITLKRDVECQQAFDNEKSFNPVLTVDDPRTNLRWLLKNGSHFWAAWNELIKRNFLVENKITFPEVLSGGDFIWDIEVLCCAERFLRIATPVYFYRATPNTNSMHKKKRKPEEQIAVWNSAFILWAKALKKLADKLEILQKNPGYCHSALRLWFSACYTGSKTASDTISSYKIYEILNNSFADKDNDFALMLPFIFSVIYAEKKRGDQLEKNFKNSFTARIDMQLVPAEKDSEGDFKIVSVSDKQADIRKPTWFQKGGIGYQIQSHTGGMEIIAKATVDGKVSFALKGLDVRDPKNTSKRIPQWVDYINLTINGKRILNKRTPAWHDKAYIYSTNVKAGEEIKIETEWLPHRDDINVSAVAPPKEDEALRKLKNYFSARIDMQLVPAEGEGDFKIVSVSDKQANVRKPGWLQKGGIGYQIQSYSGSMEIIAKATADGKINLDLKGLDVRDPKNPSKRIPQWIDYINLTINGKRILNKRTPAWHDKAYIYSTNVKADEEVTIQAEWLPHRDDIKVSAVIEPLKEDEVISKFKDYFTARLDMQLDSETEPCEFKILSISDDKAKVGKANWLPENADGCFIQSYNGNMEVVAKAVADGQLQVKLKGLDVHDAEDNSKRVPYWIDYTKLTINDEVIFDARTPAWHDKPYIYTLQVKADDEIKIETEWLPHKEEPAVVEPPKEDEAISKFKDYFTARLDMQLDSETTPCEFKILSISDDKAKVGKASWLPENADGCFIQSYNGNMEVVAKAAADGQLQIKLKGLDVHDTEDDSKRIPYWIDYTKLTINNEVIFDARTPAWHDKPYIYTLEVKADDEVKIETEWLPHKEEPAVVEPPKEDEAISKFKDYFTARLDMQLDSETTPCEFQILSISDDKAKIGKASWLPDNADGCFIQSYNGNMEVVGKAAADGQLQIKLKGVDVRDKEDNSKCIPYWIDYTKLTINDEVIFDARTPAWHDKPYIYTLQVKADDEIKIETEWLPHKEEPAVVEPPKEDEAISKFKDYFTARLDMQLDSETTPCEFKILTISDDKAKVGRASWLPENADGCFIQSYNGNMEVVAKAAADGQLQVKLKGLDVRDKEDDSKRIPYWIDYTKLTINNEVIFDARTPAWHDKPYIYTLEVKADDEIKIETEWLPHREIPAVAPPKEPPKEDKVINKKDKDSTARIDVKLVSDEECELKIVSASDEKADIRKAGWLPKNENGYFIHSDVGDLEIVAKAENDGKINLDLKGMDIRDKEDKSKRVPCWIDYTRLIVNGKKILGRRISTWHDRPYRYTTNVKAGDEIKIKVTWLPHKSK